MGDGPSRTALPAALTGRWSSTPFDYGAMETSELAFLGDGRGWSVFLNVFELSVTRFRWHCPLPGVLELRAEWRVSGAPAEPPAPLGFASAGPPVRTGGVTRHPYVIGPAVDPYGQEHPVVVAFEEPVEFASRFVRGSSVVAPGDDPSHPVLPYPESGGE